MSNEKEEKAKYVGEMILIKMKSLEKKIAELKEHLHYDVKIDGDILCHPTKSEYINTTTRSLMNREVLRELLDAMDKYYSKGKDFDIYWFLETVRELLKKLSGGSKPEEPCNHKYNSQYPFWECGKCGHREFDFKEKPDGLKYIRKDLKDLKADDPFVMVNPAKFPVPKELEKPEEPSEKELAELKEQLWQVRDELSMDYKVNFFSKYYQFKRTIEEVLRDHYKQRISKCKWTIDALKSEGEKQQKTMIEYVEDDNKFYEKQLKKLSGEKEVDEKPEEPNDLGFETMNRHVHEKEIKELISKFLKDYDDLWRHPNDLEKYNKTRKEWEQWKG